jgi:hypothetical protein
LNFTLSSISDHTRAGVMHKYDGFFSDIPESVDEEFSEGALSSDFSLEPLLPSTLAFNDSDPPRQLKKWAIAPPTS